MKVLIFGSTGFIGLPVAQAFVRAGHIVYGHTRSQDKAENLLAPEEIIPIVLDHSTDEGRGKWGKIAETVDVVIDTVPASSPDVPLATFKQVEQYSTARPEGAKIAYLYTGGSWVQSRGAGGLDTWTDERQGHSGQVKATKWRWDVEKEILASSQVDGMVIRAAVLYGRSGSLFSKTTFKPAMDAAKNGEVFEAFAMPDSRVQTIHQDDLADLYLRVAERSPICRGRAFIGANQHTERLTDILDAVQRVSGAKGYKIRSPDNLFEQAWASTSNFKPSLGYALTGWTPKKMSLVDGMDVYWASYLASLKQ